MKRSSVWILSVLLAAGLMWLGAGCSGGSGSSGDDDSGTGQQVPQAPSGLEAQGQLDLIVLSWHDNSSDEDGFRIYFREHGKDDFELLTELEADTTYYEHQAGYEKHYDYVVTAFNEAGESERSNEADAYTAPNAPSNLEAAVDERTVELTWTDNSQTEDGFMVYRKREEDEQFAQIATLDANTTSITDTLGEEGVYVYKVTAYNDSGESAYSNEAQAVTSPNAPVGLTVEAKKYHATLTWTDTSNLEAGFIVERLDPGDEEWHDVVTLPENTTEFTDSGLECGGTRYEYRVRAYNSSGVSDSTDAVETTTQACWTFEVVDSEGDVGGFLSATMDSADNLHIAYYDITNRDLKYATNAGKGWTIQTVDSEGKVGAHTSIAVDSNGSVHIAYVKFYGELSSVKYATNASGGWDIYTVESDLSSSEDTAITVDSSGKPHIAYHADYGSHYYLNYANHATGSWFIYTIGPEDLGSYYISMAQDSDGNLHISHFELGGWLMYTTNSSGSWESVIVDSEGTTGIGSCLVLAQTGDVFISYSTPFGDTDVRYARKSSTGWEVHTVDSDTYVGYYTSIALDSGGWIHITYYDAENKDLKYAVLTSEGWNISTIDSEGNVGYYNEVLIDSEDWVHIIYRDSSNGDLLYATNKELE